MVNNYRFLIDNYYEIIQYITQYNEIKIGSSNKLIIALNPVKDIIHIINKYILKK
jgi:hypothetical protein